MEIITSAHNATVKRLAKLKLKKYRDETGEFFIEGYKNVLDTASACPGSVRAVILSERAFAAHGAEFSAFPVTVVSDALADKLTDTCAGQGIISINAQKASEFPTAEGCILLDRVRDPGNVGTVLRTAIAAGYDAVLNNCADVYSPKAARSAMSAVLKCRIGLDIPPLELKKAGYEIIVADMRGENVYTARPPEGKYCIVIGNEADGVSDGMRAAADAVLAVPQTGIESLNAAVAAAVMMFTLAARKK